MLFQDYKIFTLKRKTATLANTSKDKFAFHFVSLSISNFVYFSRDKKIVKHHLVQNKND